MDISRLILDDHYEHRRLFSVLEDVETLSDLLVGQALGCLMGDLQFLLRQLPAVMLRREQP